jgi:predicted acylesterase/phospholipase RssA
MHVTKRALVLGGGSALGAYEAGIIDEITENDPDRHYDILTGISVGSINSGFLAQAKRGELREFSIKLNELWFGVEGNKDIYKKTIWGVLRLAWETGVFNTEPLRELITANFDPQLVRDSGNVLRFGCVDLLTGRYVESTEHSDNLIDWMMASAALPFAFPTPHIGEGIYTDGGMRSPTAISAAIDAGCEEIDLVLTSPLHYETRMTQLTADQMKNGLQLGLRLLDVMHDQTFIDALKMLNFCNKLADYGDPDYKKMTVNVYAPSKTLNTDMILTTFDPKWIRDWWILGKQTKPIPLEEFINTVKATQEV